MRVLMLSMHDSEQYFFEALRVGAGGYVVKNAADDDLVEACRAVMRGGTFIYPGAVRALVRNYVEALRDGELPSEDPLSPRETEVLKLIAEGATGREIAATLHIAENTVERHRANLLSKLGLRDRVALTRYAIRRGLIQP
jgi:DNA-binding NarL/FixJ family response regulator